MPLRLPRNWKEIEKKRNVLRACLYPKAVGEARIRLANLVVIRRDKRVLFNPKRIVQDLTDIYEMLGKAMSQVMLIGDGVILPSDSVGGRPESRTKKRG